VIQIALPQARQPEFRVLSCLHVGSTMASSQPVAAAEGEPSTDDFVPIFYVGHHESERAQPVTDFVLRQAQDIGVYLVSPHSRIHADTSSMTC
jgi:protein arginine N-methyltransferase 5